MSAHQTTTCRHCLGSGCIHCNHRGYFTKRLHNPEALRLRRSIPVLLQAKADILAHPDQCIMDVYFAESLDLRDERGMYRRIKAGGCGTAGCIAAWILHGAYGKATLEETQMHARVGQQDGLVQQANNAAELEGREGDFLFCFIESNGTV